MSELIQIEGFTNQVLGWKARLPTVKLDDASAEQLAVLEESHPQAKTSDYYLTLAHHPDILRQRSQAFNAIMYAPGGLSRAERSWRAPWCHASTAVCIALRCTRNVSNNWPNAMT